MFLYLWWWCFFVGGQRGEHYHGYGRARACLSIRACVCGQACIHMHRPNQSINPVEPPTSSGSSYCRGSSAGSRSSAGSPAPAVREGEGGGGEKGQLVPPPSNNPSTHDTHIQNQDIQHTQHPASMHARTHVGTHQLHPQAAPLPRPLRAGFGPLDPRIHVLSRPRGCWRRRRRRQRRALGPRGPVVAYRIVHGWWWWPAYSPVAVCVAVCQEGRPRGQVSASRVCARVRRSID